MNECRGSHLIKHLLRKYPKYHIINVDRIAYCSQSPNDLLQCLPRGCLYEFHHVYPSHSYIYLN